jgi:predicted component of type VI protein secretion system
MSLTQEELQKILNEEASEALRQDYRFLEDVAHVLDVGVSDVMDMLAGDEPFVNVTLDPEVLKSLLS